MEGDLFSLGEALIVVPCSDSLKDVAFAWADFDAADTPIFYCTFLEDMAKVDELVFCECNLLVCGIYTIDGLPCDFSFATHLITNYVYSPKTPTGTSQYFSCP